MPRLSFGENWLGTTNSGTKLTSHQITCFLENAYGFISSNRGNSSRNADTRSFGIVHFRASYGENGIGWMGGVFEQKDISRLPGAQQHVVLLMNQPTDCAQVWRAYTGFFLGGKSATL